MDSYFNVDLSCSHWYFGQRCWKLLQILLFFFSFFFMSVQSIQLIIVFSLWDVSSSLLDILLKGQQSHVCGGWIRNPSTCIRQKLFNLTCKQDSNLCTKLVNATCTQASHIFSCRCQIIHETLLSVLSCHLPTVIFIMTVGRKKRCFWPSANN